MCVDPAVFHHQYTDHFFLPFPGGHCADHFHPLHRRNETRRITVARDLRGRSRLHYELAAFVLHGRMFWNNVDPHSPTGGVRYEDVAYVRTLTGCCRKG